MDTPEIQMPQAGRRRGRYSDQFKRQVIAACFEPGISTAAVALAKGLNANLARRWVAESSQHKDTLATLHHKVLAVGAFWDSSMDKSGKKTIQLAVARQRRPWFEGFWANAGEPLAFTDSAKNPNEQSRLKGNQSDHS
ncbi:MAG: transposase [Rhodoferax sp.]|uniref:transposase n=1 Tax=Rhodoferax sp. TaxID=50421 RepID=UPI0026067B29|nr:transposase [Rhodoferax sp.]MDD2881449.1 transposase [Rhodoferax sp.]